MKFFVLLSIVCVVSANVQRRDGLLDMAKHAAAGLAAKGANMAINAAANGAKNLVKSKLGRRDSLLSMAKSAAGKVAAAGANKAIDMATAGAKNLVKSKLGRRAGILDKAKEAAVNPFETELSHLVTC